MKTLIIAEKPSVGRDIAGALDGVFQKRALADLSPKAKKGGKDEPTFLESDDYVITWAVGHLVQLAEPEEYDEKWKKWRMADLPIVPPERLQARPARREVEEAAEARREAPQPRRRRPRRQRLRRRPRGRADLRVPLRVGLRRGADDPDAPKPVERLWISSMTKQAIREGFDKLRPGEQLQPLESAARARSEADWLVGMNATRAATIRGRAWVGGVVSLGRVQTPTLAIIVRREREIQAFVPEPYWLVHASFDPRYEGLWFDPLKADDKDTPTGQETWLKEAERADEIVDQGLRQDRHRRVGRAQGAVPERAAPLRPHVAPARRELPLRLLRAPHAPGRPVPVRGQEGDHVSAHELPLPLRRPRPAAEADGRDARRHPRVRDRRPASSSSSTSCRSAASSTTRGSTTTTRSSQPTSSTT